MSVNPLSRHPVVDATPDFLTGGGEMGKAIAAKDWSETPLGPIEHWPQSLRTTVSLCLASNFPISIAWGEHRTQIYNDGYWPICGAKHPYSMGQDFRECWASAWPAIGKAFEAAEQGEARFLENQRMFLDRNGYLEETFFTFSFSPIRDESGGVGGLFHPVTETTAKMLSERRTQALRDLAARTTNASTLEEACASAAAVLAENELDFPFTLLYLVNEAGDEVQLVGSSGVEEGCRACPAEIRLRGSDEVWPVSHALNAGQPQVVEHFAVELGLTSCGPYPELPSRAFVLPIQRPGHGRSAGVLIAGVSPRLPLDEAYRGFYDLVARQLATAISNARAYEEERRRADALAELDRAKTQFFSNVSHEFRTPLTLMLGPLEELMAGGTDSITAKRDEVDLIYRNGLRLLRLVNALLDFSRLEAGREKAHFEPLELASLTADYASSFRSATEKAGLQFFVDCPTLSGLVYIDRLLWEKVVLNLISNAFKFTLAGAIRVTLREFTSTVELAVSDTGTGIPEAALGHLFDRFYRVEHTCGRSHEGTGIGLSLVQEVVKLHGGTVQVESKVGEGTTFRVS
ncbi:MAG TPA: GAF domain-containing sensor histidine kinase, partial [Bryobacteraceae bacterium]|nr:GAF domain-containing sensor histidine kinase [Bryobacteraceae bacterium]